MNVKRLTARHGAVNGKLMVMTHQRSDVAAIEAFMGRIGAYDALLICKSVRGIRVGNTRYPIEVLLWLMACYNNPYFVKTFYLNKYFGYESDTESGYALTHPLVKRSLPRLYWDLEQHIEHYHARFSMATLIDE